MCFKVIFGYGYALEGLFRNYFQQQPENIGNFIEIRVPPRQNVSLIDLKSQNYDFKWLRTSRFISHVRSGNTYFINFRKYQQFGAKIT